jgi:hypothetical protein
MADHIILLPQNDRGQAIINDFAERTELKAEQQSDGSTRFGIVSDEHEVKVVETRRKRVAAVRCARGAGVRLRGPSRSEVQAATSFQVDIVVFAGASASRESHLVRPIRRERPRAVSPEGAGG